MHRIVALALPDVVAFDLSIPAQVFGHADERDWYSFSVATPGAGLVRTTTGFSVLATADLDELDAADTVVVPGHVPPGGEPDARATASLRRAHDRGARVVSVCTGAFALAEAGILDGRRATTHWRDAGRLASRYPRIDVDPDVLFIDDDGAVATSAGVAAGIDLCLHLVRRDRGAAVAARIARRMVVPAHRDGGQAQYIERPVPDVSAFQKVCDWALESLDGDLSLAVLAQRAGWSTRTFSRRFTAETGMSPHRWITAQRLGRARALLETTDLAVEDVAVRVGLGSAGNLRARLRQESGTLPSAHRRAFRDHSGSRPLADGPGAHPSPGVGGSGR